MLAVTYHVLLVAALATSFVAIARRIDERLGGAVSTILWGLVAVGSFEIEQTRAVTGNVTQTYNGTSNVTITQEGGEVVTEASAAPEVAFFAASLALVMLIFTLAAATGQLPQRTATRYVSNE